MQIIWHDEKTKKQCEDIDFLTRTYDMKLAKKLAQRLIELELSEDYVKVPVSSRKHSIKQGKKFLYFAVDLPTLGDKRGKYRLTFIPIGEYDMENQKTITSIKILGIENYH